MCDSYRDRNNNESSIFSSDSTQFALYYVLVCAIYIASVAIASHSNSEIITKIISVLVIMFNRLGGLDEAGYAQNRYAGMESHLERDFFPE